MKKKSAVFLFLFTLLCGFYLSADNDLSDLRGLTLTNAKIPIYNRSGKPQMMIFVNKADRHGRVISGKGTVLDFLRPTAGVDDIKDAWRIKLYPLEAPFKEVFDFWLPRLKYSEAIVRTSQADIDRENHKASGSSVVFLRSPLLDLNGVGFEADFKRREIRINSDIEVLIRTSGSDPRKLTALKEKDYQYITASGDSLLIELESKRIMLIGSVTIRESQTVINCDRLTVMLNRTGKKAAGDKKKLDLSSASDVSGISQLLADGHIVVTGKDANAGKVYADHMVYDLQEKEIILSSDIFPEMQTFRQLRRQIKTVSTCALDKIPGYVVVDNPQMRSFGTKVAIRLKKDGKNTLSTGALAGTQMNAAPGGSLQNIVYPDGVFICGKEDKNSQNTPFAVQADYCEYLPGENVINLRNNVYANEGTNDITCDTAELKIKRQSGSSLAGNGGLESIHCRRNVRLLHREKNQQKGNLTADKADFYPNGNKIVFHENVNADHNGSKLSCKQLELFLADRKAAAKQPVRKIRNGSSRIQTAAAGAKTLRQIVASGNVVMTDPRAVLRTGLLTLNFRELRPGEKPVQSMLQSGNVRLSSIICDNGLKVVSAGSPDASKASGFFGKGGSQGIKNLTAMRSLTDLEKNINTFSGNIKINDDLSSLTCDTMHLYSAVRRAVAKTSAPKAEDIDEDPFALLKTENYAPSQILIGENMELRKVECIGNVRLARTVEKKQIKAGGQRADYDVKGGKIILSGKSPERAWINAENTRQTSDRLIYHLAEERFESSGNTETTSLTNTGEKQP